MIRLELVLISLVLSAALVSPVRADEGASRRAATSFAEGRDAMKRGDLDAACPKFTESQRLDPAPGTLLNLALCEEQRGDLAVARSHLEEVVDQLPPTDARTKIAKEHIAAIDGRLPAITIRLLPSAPHDTAVSLDGTPIDSSRLGAALRTEPGRHTLRVTASGRMPRTFEVTVAAGEHRDVAVGPGAAGEASAATAGRDNTAAYVALGIGGVGVVTGGVLWAVLNKKSDIVDNNCDQDRICNDAGLDAADSGERLTPFYTGAWIVGAAGLVAGSYLLFAGSDDEPPGASVGVAPTVGGATVAYEGSF